MSRLAYKTLLSPNFPQNSVSLVPKPHFWNLGSPMTHPLSNVSALPLQPFLWSHAVPSPLVSRSCHSCRPCQSCALGSPGEHPAQTSPSLAKPFLSIQLGINFRIICFVKHSGYMVKFLPQPQWTSLLLWPRLCAEGLTLGDITGAAGDLCHLCISEQSPAWSSCSAHAGSITKVGQACADF